MSEPIGQYKVLGELGSGASSRIFKVRLESDGKEYALKVISVSSSEDRKFVAQAERDYEVSSELKHPSLVRSYAFETNRRMFRTTGAKLLMDYVDGRPLTLVTKLPMIKLVKIFYEVSDGLVYLHRKGIYHADIKPDNIMVTSEVKAKVIDFGLAWKSGESKDRVQGTLEFLAPEQAQKKIVNASTDIFNLGATMYRVFTGKPILSEIRRADSKEKILQVDTLVRPVRKENHDVPKELDLLIRKCVKRAAYNRPVNMKEVRNELRKIGLKLSRANRKSST
ncbi:Serine/threonine-protein kinase PknB [Planctomycetes bacterium Pan216]|uniref:Serine/threonine-protein kinase PknB n=1 Tax=Kolteria novifilia TaxID=2527975 RepID=A0A518BAD5_9BACT|nr:Serine/threonine-protein kinase PknB [Planctomycetes bacterium Pan216]